MISSNNGTGSKSNLDTCLLSAVEKNNISNISQSSRSNLQCLIQEGAAKKSYECLSNNVYNSSNISSLSHLQILENNTLNSEHCNVNRSLLTGSCSELRTDQTNIFDSMIGSDKIMTQQILIDNKDDSTNIANDIRQKNQGKFKLRKTEVKKRPSEKLKPRTKYPIYLRIVCTHTSSIQSIDNIESVTELLELYNSDGSINNQSSDVYSLITNKNISGNEPKVKETFETIGRFNVNPNIRLLQIPQIHEYRLTGRTVAKISGETYAIAVYILSWADYTGFKPSIWNILISAHIPGAIDDFSRNSISTSNMSSKKQLDFDKLKYTPPDFSSSNTSFSLLLQDEDLAFLKGEMMCLVGKQEIMSASYSTSNVEMCAKHWRSLILPKLKIVRIRTKDIMILMKPGYSVIKGII